MDGGPPVFPPGFTCPAVLWIQPGIVGFRIRDSHPVSSAFPCRSPNLSSPFAVRTPRIRRPSVWPLPRSLATTGGISVDVFSWPYLDVSVQAVPFLRLFYSTQDTGVWLQWVPPFGYPRINAYLQLPEAFRSLSRPSSAPDAKASPLRPSSLDLSSRKSPSGSVWFSSLRELCKLHFLYLLRYLLPDLTNASTSIKSLSVALLACFSVVQFSRCKAGNGGPKWARTTDLTIISRTL